MAVSAAISVAAYSVVMVETFMAVAASTLAPATFLALLRAAKAGGGAADNEAGDTLLERAPGLGDMIGALSTGAAQVNEIDLLVPKTANISGEFEFEASERYRGDVAVGALVNVVAVAAGYSQLYQTATRNKITFNVDFAAVNYTV